MQDEKIITKDERQPFVFAVNDVPHIAVPPGFEIDKVEESLPRPKRDSRSVQVATPESFIQYMLKHGSEDAAVYIRSDWMRGAKIFATGIMDDAHAGITSWRDHTVSLTPRTTKEFDEWRQLDGQDLSQYSLCTFLDKHLAHIVKPEGTAAPTAAEVMTFAANLEDIKKVEFKKSIRLDNGRVQLTYNEEDASGSVVIPRDFFIRVRVLAGRPDQYVLPVRMRYRIREETKLIFTLDIVGLDDLIDHIAEELTQEVQLSLKDSGWNVYTE